MTSVIIPITMSVDLPVPPPAPSGGGFTGPYKSSAECAPYALITGAGVTSWARVYEVTLPALSVGDLLLIATDAEIRNDNTFGVECVSGLWLTPSDMPANADSMAGALMLNKLNGENITRDRHYMTLTKSVHHQVEVARPAGHKIVLRVRARTEFPGSGNVLDVMAGYGSISVIRVPAP